MILTSVLLPAVAQADTAVTPARSLLLSVGQTSQPTGDMGTPMQNLGYSNLNLLDDKYANSVALGYRQPIGGNWSIDYQYLDQSKTTPQMQATLPLGKSNAQAAQEIAQLLPKRGQGISAVALHHQPLGKGWKAQVGGGAFVWHSERKATVGDASYTAKQDGASPVIQLGVGYPLTKKIWVEANWQHFFMPDEAVDRVAAGVAVGF